MTDMITALTAIYLPIIGALLWDNKRNKERIDAIEEQLRKKTTELNNERVKRNELKDLVKRLIYWFRWFKNESVDVAERSYKEQKPVSKNDYHRLKHNKTINNIINDNEILK